MPSVNLRVKIIEENQPLSIEARIENASVESKDRYREQTIREYTTCENVVFYPVEIFREENR